jgi:hypothetical protein
MNPLPPLERGGTLGSDGLRQIVEAIAELQRYAIVQAHDPLQIQANHIWALMPKETSGSGSSGGGGGDITWWGKITAVESGETTGRFVYTVRKVAFHNGTDVSTSDVDSTDYTVINSNEALPRSSPDDHAQVGEVVPVHEVPSLEGPTIYVMSYERTSATGGSGSGSGSGSGVPDTITVTGDGNYDAVSFAGTYTFDSMDGGGRPIYAFPWSFGESDYRMLLQYDYDNGWWEIYSTYGPDHNYWHAAGSEMTPPSGDYTGAGHYGFGGNLAIP